MAPFDRDGALKKAEKALRQGRIDAAIEEYVRVVEAQPRDWNSANQLGDLYVRANQVEKGIGQYTRIADHLAGEGFYPKASALYKKILKIRPDDEHSLEQAGDIAFKQGLLADAKTYFRAVVERRKARGDKKGAAEFSIRIGTLDPEDLEARLGAARAAAEIGDVMTALREYKDVALKYEKSGKPGDALAVLQLALEINPQDADVRSRLLSGYLQTGDLARAREVATSVEELKQVGSALEAAGRHDELLEVLGAVAELDPDDMQVRASLAQAYAGRGDLERAAQYLNAETAGTNPGLWLTLAEMELQGGRIEEGRAAVVQALTLDPAQREAVVALGCRLAEKSSEAGYPCIDAVADAALAADDFGAAAAALHEFVTRVRYHVIALMRLVDVCVDGGLEATMYEAQAQLADAYLEVGRGLEARIISEDLVAREPWNRANLERFRRALVMLGESDPDAIIAERLSGESPFLTTDKLDLNEGSFDEGPGPAAVAQPADAELDSFEIDLDSTLAEAVASVSTTPVVSAPPKPRPVLTPAPPPNPESPASGSQMKARSLDQVFKEMRDESSRNSGEEAAGEQYRLALTYRDLGMTDEAIKALEAAARSPRQRFDACSMLGRVYVEKDDTALAVDWFERAAEAPAPTPDAGRALLYDLAEILEKIGEHARALAVFVELESESGGYRDVASRIDRLSKVQAKG